MLQKIIKSDDVFRGYLRSADRCDGYRNIVERLFAAGCGHHDFIHHRTVFRFGRPREFSMGADAFNPRYPHRKAAAGVSASLFWRLR